MEIQEAISGLRVLSAIQAGEFQQAVNLYRFEFQPEVEWRYQPRRSGFYANPWMWFDGPRFFDVFLTGVQDQDSAVAFMLGYGRFNRELPMRANANVVASVSANEVYDTIGVRPAGKTTRIFGHSAGGATGEVLAAGIDDIIPNALIGRIHTYGSPSAGFSNVYLGYLSMGLRHRWMAYGDPVPLIPTSGRTGGPADPIDRADQSGLLVVVMMGGRPFACTQPAGGWNITHSTISAAQYPNLPEGRQVALEKWIGGDSTYRRYHSIGNYLSTLATLERSLKEQEALLDLARERRGPVVPAGPVLGVLQPPWEQLGGPATPPGPNVVLPIELGRSLPPSGVTTARVDSAGLTLFDGTNVSAEWRDRVMAQAKLRPPLTMTVVKAGGQWLVVWNDFLIAAYQYPSSARTLARAGNRFLRLMGSRGGIYMPTFVDAFSSFIQIASAGDPSYQPPLTVNP